MAKMKFALICLMSIVFAGTTLATPVWRTDPAGQPPTTYQEWTFDTDPYGWSPGDADPVLDPEVDLNSYGDPTATLDLMSAGPYTGWFDLTHERQGVWRAWDMGITLDIPNSDIPNDYTEIWGGMGLEG